MVWTIDGDGEGVCVGHYFNDREEAEWDICARVFEWFEDNANIHMIEDETEKRAIILNGAKSAREVIAKAAQMIDEMCGELDKLKTGRTISIEIGDYMAQLLRYVINVSENRRERSD